MNTSPMPVVMAEFMAELGPLQAKDLAAVTSATKVMAFNSFKRGYECAVVMLRSTAEVSQDRPGIAKGLNIAADMLEQALASAIAMGLET